jgi:hypothetical protein
MVIRRVGALSVAKVAGVLYALIGLIAGAFISLAAIVGGFGSGDTNAPLIGALMGAGAIIVIPIVYGGLGFIGTLIMAALYNLVAGAVGGIEVDVEPGTNTGI